MKRKFHVGDVLSVTTFCMVSPRGMDGLYDILNFLTGERLFTHQLIRAAERAAPVLVKRFPDLGKVKKPVFSFTPPESEAEQEAMVAAWVAEQGLPMEFEIEPLVSGDYVSMDPIAELIAIRGGHTDGILQIDEMKISEVPEPRKVFS